MKRALVIDPFSYKLFSDACPGKALIPMAR